MSEYDVQPGGSLKLKGAVIGGRVVKKKKKKPKRRYEEAEQVASREEISGSAPGSGRNSPAVIGGSSSGSPQMTDAQKRFEKKQKETLARRVAELAGKTHKDRVNEFNAKLEALSEHHDIPKVGPG